MKRTMPASETSGDAHRAASAGSRRPGRRAAGRSVPVGAAPWRGRRAARSVRSASCAASSVSCVARTTAAPPAVSVCDGGGEERAGGGVHAARRLVEQDQGRRAGQRRRQRGPLTLAGAQVARVAVGQARGGRRRRASPPGPRSLPARRRVRATSSRTVGRWSSAPGFCGRYAVRPPGAATVPASGGSSPASVRSSVVLPEPFGPDQRHDLAAAARQRDVVQHRAPRPGRRQRRAAPRPARRPRAEAAAAGAA